MSAFITSLAVGLIVYASVAIHGAPPWARVGFGLVAMTVYANGVRAAA